MNELPSPSEGVSKLPLKAENAIGRSVACLCLVHDPAISQSLIRGGEEGADGRPIAPDANLKGVAMKAYQIVDADFVKREIGRMPIVDVRPPLRYDTAHIPSAINIRLDVAAASDDPAEELAEMFQDNGIFPEDAVIVYCQMGVHAKIACDYLASAGYSKLYLYAGSMNDWMRDSARPVEASSVAFAKAS